MAASSLSQASVLKESLIREISEVVNRQTGVQLGGKQVAMVESRLKRRLFELGFTHWEQYRAHFDRHRNEEVESLISLLTTHHTFFFREFVQFEFLEKELPKIVAAARARGATTLEVLSAACSRGQEVYSLAMFLKKHLPAIDPTMQFKILGTDVDPASVGIASNGVYRRDELKTVPLAYLAEHWARGSGEIADFAKAKKSLRDHCDFSPMNLMDMSPLGTKKFDIVFCRNVFIYFTPEQIKEFTQSLLKHLYPGGDFFIGVSESLHALSLPLRAVGPSVYRTLEAVPSPEKAKAPVQAPAKTASVVARQKPMPNPLRVVCVDDSSSILSLLKKILAKDKGFEVVATAANGEEAQKVVEREKPDLITLDIHMPVKTGLEYLEASKGRRPPVVMITSVSRDDADLAWKALSLGAADYVEKPTLSNLEERAEEIRAKLRSAYRLSGGTAPKPDKEFTKVEKIADPGSCAVLVVTGVGGLEKCASLFKDLKATGVSVSIGLEGADAILPAVAERLAKASGAPVPAGSVMSLKEATAALEKTGKRCSVQVLGEISEHGAKGILQFAGAQLLLEDLGGGEGARALKEVASDVVPFTSFAYLAHKYFAEKK